MTIEVWETSYSEYGSSQDKLFGRLLYYAAIQNKDKLSAAPTSCLL